MVVSKWPTTIGPCIKAVCLLFLLISPVLLTHEIGAGGIGTRSGSKAVEIVINDTRILSGGISQWGPFSLGIVNKTTIVETRIRNNLDAPLSGVKVNLTIYWYDAVEGFSFDKGRIIHKDSAQVSLPAGKGKLSGVVNFPWVPSSAGSYILNLSAHAPGDPRPVTHFVLIGGYKYSTGTTTLTDGRWVGTAAYNASTMDGWTTFTEGAEQSDGWHVSDHYLGEGYEDLHTDDGVFWVGNETTKLSPRTGFHNLVSPVLDLRDFDPKPYDVFTGSIRPQVYFLYKYRGNISSEGPLGVGGIFHWIRYRKEDVWSDWERLYDAKEQWINISGNTTDVIWDWAKRPYRNGDIDFVGLDLGDYQGKDVQLRFQYRPSGFDEPGYVLDDLTLIGKHRVDITPFELVSYTQGTMEVEPGSSLELSLELRSKLTSIDPDISLRVDCVSSSEFINRDHDITIEPQLITLMKDDDDVLGINITVDVPGNAPYGPGWIEVRIIAGGLVKDIRYDLIVLSRRSLQMSITGDTDGAIGPDMTGDISINVVNQGNIFEGFNMTFISPDGLNFNGELGHFGLEPDTSMDLEGGVWIGDDALSGKKTGLFILSRGNLNNRQQLMDIIGTGELDPTWMVQWVEYDMVQRWSVQLYSTSPASTFIMVEEPPVNGTLVYGYDLIVHNSGNGVDNVSFLVDERIDRSDMTVHFRESMVMDPGEIRILHVELEVEFPVPWGLYNFSIKAVSQGPDDREDALVMMSLSIGPPSITEGVFLVNGSLEIEPQELILGREALVSFTVRSFGLADQDTFAVNLWMDGKVVATHQFNLTRVQDKEYQIPWTFMDPGYHTVNISISEGILPNDDRSGLSDELSSEVLIKYIDLFVGAVDFTDLTGEVNLSDLPPGGHDITVSIGNNGDVLADMVTVVLELLDRETGSIEEHVVNLTDVLPGSHKELTFKNIIFREDSLYQIGIWIDDGDRWRDIDVDNDLKTIDVEVGEKPPEEPFWRNTVVNVIAFIVAFISVGLFFIYLMRRKLSS